MQAFLEQNGVRIYDTDGQPLPYTRLATVVCAEPGRLLRLSSEDFQWLIDTEPTVHAELARVLAERLQER